MGSGSGVDDVEVEEDHQMTIVSAAAARHAWTVRFDLLGARRIDIRRGRRGVR